MEHYSRRGFIKGAIGAGIALSLPQIKACSLQDKNPYDAKGLPTVLFGSTGIFIPKIVLGLGSRFCHITKAEEAEEMLNYALDNGLYYWDTAHTYDNTIALPPGKAKPTEHVISEVRVGEVVKYRRKEVFLSTKVTAREPSEAMKEIELSLKRLQADRVDMLKIHNVRSIADVDQMSQKGHLVDILLRMKEEGVTRFIGYSGHGDAEAMKEMSHRAPFDSMLIAMNHWNAQNKFDREGLGIPAGKEKKMGVLLMKAVRPKETIKDLKATDLIRYAMSLEGPDAVVIGMDSVAIVKSNLELMRNFQPMNNEEQQQMAMALTPFFNHEHLEWMQAGYRDGNWTLKA